MILEILILRWACRAMNSRCKTFRLRAKTIISVQRPSQIPRKVETIHPTLMLSSLCLLHRAKPHFNWNMIVPRIMGMSQLQNATTTKEPFSEGLTWTWSHLQTRRKTLNYRRSICNNRTSIFRWEGMTITLSQWMPNCKSETIRVHKGHPPTWVAKRGLEPLRLARVLILRLRSCRAIFLWIRVVKVTWTIKMLRPRCSMNIRCHHRWKFSLIAKTVAAPCKNQTSN